MKTNLLVLNEEEILPEQIPREPSPTSKSLSDPQPSNDEILREGFIRVFFESTSFASSTVLRIDETTSAEKVITLVAHKVRVPIEDIPRFSLVIMCFDGKGIPRIVRTLKSDENPLVLQENHLKSISELSSPSSSLDSPSNHGDVTQVRPRHRSRLAVKFIFKDCRVAIATNKQDDEYATSSGSDDEYLSFFKPLDHGEKCGYLLKESLKYGNVWRKRWFVLKTGRIFYCKSLENQKDITSISLVDVSVIESQYSIIQRNQFCFQICTANRTYRLSAFSRCDMIEWIVALHRQVQLCSDNQSLEEAEKDICDQEDHSSRTKETNSDLKGSCLNEILENAYSRNLLMEFLRKEGTGTILDAWIQCENYSKFFSEKNTLTIDPGQQWSCAKTIADGVVEVVQQFEEVIIGDKTLIQKIKHASKLVNRLSLALEIDGHSHVEQPPVKILCKIQQQLFNILESGPYKRFLNGSEYEKLIQLLIGR